jgi:hypothetical protein
MSLQDEWAADAAEILAEIPKAVTVRKNLSGSITPFNVLMTPPMVEQNLETGGFLNATSFDVKFLRSAAAAAPGVISFGNVLTYNGQDYRIVAINDRPPSAWIIAKVQTKGGPA